MSGVRWKQKLTSFALFFALLALDNVFLNLPIKEVVNAVSGR